MIQYYNRVIWEIEKFEKDSVAKNKINVIQEIKQSVIKHMQAESD